MKDARLVLKTETRPRTVVTVGDRATIGDRDLVVMAGPCTVESREQLEQTARHLRRAPVQLLRGGAFKPRTSPYSFQGLGEAGLDLLAETRDRFGLPVVTEVMAASQIPAVAARADMLQLGSRNMQNFDLLKALGQAGKPVLLKRGLAATLEEFVMAAEYVVAHGNPNVVLCERGIRSFDTYTRNVLDLGAVVALKHLVHLPVVVDPSHAAGKRELVPDLARAAIAAGADGLMVECHPDPERSVSDARQALSLEDMVALVESLRPLAAALGRRLPEPEEALPLAA